MTSAFPGAIDSFSTKVDAVDFYLAAHMNSVQEGVIAAQTAIGQEGNSGLCEARLTLTTGVPVTTADVTGTTIYLAPFNGARLALHNGTGWVTHILTQISIAVPSTLGTMYDLFVYSNAGTPTLEALAWTNDTTRATALTTLDGVLVKTGATTRRYIGSFRTDDNLSANCQDSVARRYLWNYYNRRTRLLKVAENTGHTYNVAAWRAWNNTQGVSDVEFIVGVVEEPVVLNMAAQITKSATSGNPYFGVALNTLAGPSSLGITLTATQTARLVDMEMATYPAQGYNYAVGLEFSTVGAAAAGFEFMQVEANVSG